MAGCWCFRDVGPRIGVQTFCVGQQCVLLQWAFLQGSPSFADLMFVGVYLESMLLVNLVCIADRCGKTSICQVFAALANQKLYSVNCHLHMETSDFLGGLRPVRQKPKDKVCPIANGDVYIHLKDAVSSALVSCGILCLVGFLFQVWYVSSCFHWSARASWASCCVACVHGSQTFTFWKNDHFTPADTS